MSEGLLFLKPLHLNRDGTCTDWDVREGKPNGRTVERIYRDIYAMRLAYKIAALLLSVHLFGCSSAPSIHEAQQLTVKQIISHAHIDELFLKEVKPQGVAVGPERRVFSRVGRDNSQSGAEKSGDLCSPC